MKHHVPLFVAAIATFLASPSFAQDAARAGFDLAPSMSLDIGMGAATVGVSGTHFGVDGHPGYHVSGSTLGLMHPSGLLVYATTHYFPFKFRGVGLVTSVEGVMLSNDGTVGNVLYGNAATPDSDGPSVVSVLVGPEAQMRYGMLLFRGAVLGGTRSLSSGDFSSFEGRLAIHAQTDLVFGGGHGNSGFSFGVLGGTDIYPAFGWSAGMSLSFAMF